MNEFIDKYKNAKFGTLTVVGPEEYVMDKDMNIIQRNVYCHCDCGKQWIVVGINDLLNGLTTSCGCEGRETFRRVINSGNMQHGDSKMGIYNDLYEIWENMKFVTNYRNKNKPESEQISIYPEWLQYPAFKEWALTCGWCRTMRLNRRDFSQGYNPKNGYWAY